eukprot:29507-Pelagococcus_subviridis.AAC.5
MRNVPDPHGLVRLVPPVLVKRGHVEPAHLGRVRLHAHAVHRRRGRHDDVLGRHHVFTRVGEHPHHVLAREPGVEHVHDDHVVPLVPCALVPSRELRDVRVRDGDLRAHLIRGDVSTRARRERAVPFAREHALRARPRGHHGQQPAPRADVQHVRAVSRVSLVDLRDLPRDRGVVRLRSSRVLQRREVILREARVVFVHVDVFRVVDSELHAHGVVRARQRDDVAFGDFDFAGEVLRARVHGRRAAFCVRARVVRVVVVVAVVVVVEAAAIGKVEPAFVRAEPHGRGRDRDVVDQMQRVPKHHRVELPLALEREVDPALLALLGRVLEVKRPHLHGRRERDPRVLPRRHRGRVRRRPPVLVHRADVYAAHVVDAHFHRHRVHRRGRRKQDRVREAQTVHRVSKRRDDPAGE